MFRDLKSRAWAFGVVSGMGGIGAATGPLIGGAIATGISWRAAFGFQAIIVALILLLARGITDPLPADPDRPFDTVGAILSAAGLVVLVGGIMAADSNLALMAILMVAGAIILAGFFAWVRGQERAGKEALLSTALFRNRTSNLGMVTQNVQWAMLLGSAFVVSAYLQVVRHYNAIQTGVIFTAATVGILLSSLAQGALAKRFQQRTLIMAGFVVAIAGMIVLIAMGGGDVSPWYFAPGLFLMGTGVGVMLTRRSTSCSPPFPRASRAKSPGCRVASPTWDRLSAPRSRAPSWSPVSATPTRPTASRSLSWRSWACSASSRRSSFRVPKSRRARKSRARLPRSASRSRDGWASSRPAAGRSRSGSEGSPVRSGKISALASRRVPPVASSPAGSARPLPFRHLPFIIEGLLVSANPSHRDNASNVIKFAVAAITLPG